LCFLGCAIAATTTIPSSAASRIERRLNTPHEQKRGAHLRGRHLLLEWYGDGGDVAARLPLLSTWLGHADPKSIYWYLQAAPELLSLAAQRLEHAQAGLS
jgi:hypothetical protein